MIRVALADDHDLVRMGLRVLIEREDDLTVAGEAANGTEALRLLRREHPDVLLLDVRMPGMDGLRTLREITGDPALAGTRVVMVTTFEIDRYVFEALQAGAAGFILKDAAPVELVRAIRVVADGQALLSPSITRRVMATFSQPLAPGTAPAGLAELTAREREIVAWVATGYANDEIAERLVVSPDTVRTHVSRAMVKLRARTRAQLAVLGVRAGLTVDDSG
jgi:DNA-binding NarL/FixJ family response regulator